MDVVFLRDETRNLFLGKVGKSIWKLELLKTMEKVFDIWHIRNQIFEHLDHETLEVCRQVSKVWRGSLEKLSLLKFLYEFGDKDYEDYEQMEFSRDVYKGYEIKEVKLSSIIPAWKEVSKTYGVQASIEDLKEIKHSLQQLTTTNGNFCNDFIRKAAEAGALKLMEFLLCTSSSPSINEFGIHWDSFGIWDGVLRGACFEGQIEMVRLLIESSRKYGLDLNADDGDGYTAFHLASTSGSPNQIEVLRLMIESSKDYGINLNAQTDDDGETNFHFVCQRSSSVIKTKVVKLFIESSNAYDIDLNLADMDGLTGFHLICINGDNEVVKLMIESAIECGIDFNVRDKYGATGFYYACQNGQTETVRLLLENWQEIGIDIKMRCHEGITPLQHVNHMINEGKTNLSKVKEMLEEEYSKIDSSEPLNKKRKTSEYV